MYANQYVRVFDDEVRFQDRTPGRYLRIVHAGAGTGVIMLPVHQDTVALVRTYRYPVGEWQWALPRGFAQDPDPLLTARAELHEELGVEHASLRLLGYVTPDSGILASKVAVVAARVEDTSAVQPEDELEVADARWFSCQMVYEMAANGEIEDGMTLAALTLAWSAGILKP